MTGYSTGAANLLASDGTFNYQYDADGNRTVRTRISNAYASDYQTQYSYDYRNRLTDQESFDNNGVLTKHVHYVYDVLDREIGEQIDDTGGGTYDRTLRFVLDGAQPVEQFDANGNQTERNLVAPSPSGVDAVMAQEGITTQGQSGTTTWTLPDNLGTPRDTVNNNSAVVDHVITDAYGQVASQTNPSAQPWNGFAGGHADIATGDVTNLERQYDPSTGGWTTKDPIGLSGGDANTGRYVGNSPTNGTDPSGELSAWQWMAMAVTPMIAWPFILLGNTQAANAVLAQHRAAAEQAMRQQQSSWLDNYSSWFQANVPGGTTWVEMMAPQIQGMLGNNYLAHASDGQLLTITTIAATGTVLTGMAGTAVAGAVGATGYAGAAITGAVGGAGQYLSWTMGGQAVSGGQSNPPTLSGLATNTAGGALGGMGGHAVGQLGGWIWNGAVPCSLGGGATCFTAGTQVLVPGSIDAALASPQHTATDIGADSNEENRWIWSLLLVGVGVGGYAAAKRKSPRQEEKRREAALRALFGDEFDKLNSDDEGAWPMKSDEPHDHHRRIDALCDALFQGDDFLQDNAACAAEPVAAALPVCASTAAAQEARRRPKQAKRTAQATRLESPSGEPRRHPRRAASSRHTGAAWLVACLVLAALFGLRPPAAPQPATLGSARGVGISAAAPRHVTRSIEEIRVGQRVLGENPDLAEWEHGTQTAVDPAAWRLVRLRAEGRWDDGTLDTVEVETLQPLSWIAASGARVGRSVPIPCDLEELALPLDLHGTVTAIEPCPMLEDGLGHLVQLTVNHLNNTVYDLVVAESAGRSETINPTGIHRFYSDTRRDWVAAQNLRIGETLRGLDGPLTVARLSRRPGTDRVYNMAVEGEHVYHVSAAGALVHNAYGQPSGPLGNTFSGNATPDEALSAAEAWLGNSYSEVAPGVFQ